MSEYYTLGEGKVVEYHKYIVAVDFDGTCVTYEYPKIGKDIGAVPVLKKIVNAGHLLILNTMRGNPQTDLGDAIKWFSNNGIPLYCINHTPGQEDWTKSPKVYANLYIDDAALGCPLIYDNLYSDRPFVNWIKVENYLVMKGIIPDEEGRYL